MNPKIFPTVLMALMLASSIVYTVDGNWRMAIYWFAAAVLNAAVTY